MPGGRHDVDISVGVSGAKQSADKLKGVGKATKDVGEKAKTSAKDTDSFGGSLGKLRTLATGFLGTLIGGAGLFAAFTKWSEHLTKIADAQRDVINTTKDLNQAAKSLASQANVMGTQAGMTGARQQITQLVGAAGLQTFGQAEAVATAVHSAFGTSGQLLTPGQMGIATAVGQFAQMKDVSQRGVGELLKFLMASGVTNQEEAQKVIQQIATVQQASPVKEFEPFMVGAVKPVIGQMSRGGTLEEGLAGYSSLVGVEPTPMAAGERAEQINLLLNREKLVEQLADFKGITPLEFRNLPFDQKRQALGQYVQAHPGGAGEIALQEEAGLESAQIGMLQRAFTPELLAEQEKYRGLARGATSQQFATTAAGYRETVEGRVEAAQTRVLLERASATEEERIGQSLIEEAEAEFVTKQREGEEALLRLDEYERNELVQQKFHRRLKALRKSGRLTAEEETELAWAYSRTVKTPFDPVTPREVGEAQFAFERVEERLGVDNSVTVNNNFMRGGQAEQQGEPVRAAE